jgi:hypothetical protein
MIQAPPQKSNQKHKQKNSRNFNREKTINAVRQNN